MICEMYERGNLLFLLNLKTLVIVMHRKPYAIANTIYARIMSDLFLQEMHFECVRYVDI